MVEIYQHVADMDEKIAKEYLHALGNRFEIVGVDRKVFYGDDQPPIVAMKEWCRQNGYVPVQIEEWEYIQERDRSENLQNLIADVQSFLDAGSYPITSTPHIPDDRIRDLCKTLTGDETAELHEAIDQLDLAKILQEALDSIYVAIDVLLYHGLGDLAAEGWKQLQELNMAKVDSTGKLTLRDDGKILKPKGWTPVDWNAIIAKGTKKNASE